tara:strand:+ start:7621 stop:8496 length:876 start_codon:yes stop_codon:yes gene_type:complete
MANTIEVSGGTFGDMLNFSIGEDMVPRNKLTHPKEEWSWRDRVFNGISLDEKFEMEDKWDAHTKKRMDIILSHASTPKDTVINSRDVQSNKGVIHITGNGANPSFPRGQKLVTKRKRPATKKGNKNYETKPIKKEVQKLNKVFLLEEYEDMREKIYDPHYESDPFEAQPFVTDTMLNWKDYKGPGIWRDGYFFPPYQWTTNPPGLDSFEKIWCLIQLVDSGGYSKMYKTFSDSNRETCWGLQFFDSVSEIACDETQYHISPTKFIHETLGLSDSFVSLDVPLNGWEKNIKL